MATLSITFDDPSDSLGEVRAQIEADLQTAWANWMAILDLTETSTIDLVVRPSNETGFLVRGTTTVFEPTATAGIVRSGVGDELLTGEDPNEDAADAQLLVSLPNVDGLRFSGDPFGTVSAVTAFMHELGHIIAFNEDASPTTRTVFESLVDADPSPQFLGLFAVAANGNQGVPVTAGGNLSEAAFPNALMSATVTDANTIQNVERAMLFDMGFAVNGIDDFIEENTNNPPIALDDSYETSALVPINFSPTGLLANDSDPNGDPLAITGISITAGFGALVTQTNGSYTYDPRGFYNNLGENGVALVRIVYTLSDGRGGTDAGEVTIRVTGLPPGNQLPVARPDPFVVAEDGVLEFTATELLANDSDLDQGALTVTGVGFAEESEAAGTLEDLGDGTFRYTPAGGFPDLNDGDVTVQNLVYTLDDGQGGVVEGLIEVAVTGVTDPREGTDGDDRFEDDPELDELFLGGEGRDTVAFALPAASRSVATGEDGAVTVSGGGATDVLEEVERIEFTDGAWVFDLEGEFLPYVYRTYAAAFARTPDEVGLEFWNGIMNAGGFTEEELADAFVASGEFAEKFGTDIPDAEFINNLYENVLQREADVEGFIFWLGVFEDVGEDRARLLVEFAESTENVERTAPFLDDGVFVIHPEAVLPEDDLLTA